MYNYMHVYIYIYTHTHTYTYTYIYIYIYIQYIYVYVYIRTHGHTTRQTYICDCVSVCVLVCVHIPIRSTDTQHINGTQSRGKKKYCKHTHKKKYLFLAQAHSMSTALRAGNLTQHSSARSVMRFRVDEQGLNFKAAKTLKDALTCSGDMSPITVSIRSAIASSTCRSCVNAPADPGNEARAHKNSATSTALKTLDFATARSRRSRRTWASGGKPSCASDERSTLKFSGRAVCIARSRSACSACKTEWGDLSWK